MGNGCLCCQDKVHWERGLDQRNAETMLTMAFCQFGLPRRRLSSWTWETWTSISTRLCISSTQNSKTHLLRGVVRLFPIGGVALHPGQVACSLRRRCHDPPQASSHATGSVSARPLPPLYPGNQHVSPAIRCTSCPTFHRLCPVVSRSSPPSFPNEGAEGSPS